MSIFDDLKADVKNKNKRIIFPEGEDERIIKAAVRLKTDQLLEPVLIGNAENIKNTGLLTENLEIIDINEYPEAKMNELADALVERRKGKTDLETARKWLLNENYFATMLVYLNKADGLVSGAIHSTGDTVRPALQIIKTKKDVSLISGSFLMQKESQKYLFADCAINIDLTAQQMAEIAVESAKQARIFNIDPKVALLSFSTDGSAKSEHVDKVSEATRIAQQLDPETDYDGELQFDAAVASEVAAQKKPNSKVAGKANVFIFPDLQSGNIAYKVAQRLGGYEAVGPLLQGLAKPVSDLSRGCNEEDVYKVAIITAAQSLMN